MTRLLKSLIVTAILALAASSASAQGLLAFSGAGAPTGPCPTGLVSYRDNLTGQDYDCVATAWHLTTRTQPVALTAISLTNQSAAIAATTLYTVPATGAGLYRVSYVAKITRAATTSSVLGGTGAGFQVIYTDNDDSTVGVTSPAGVTSTLNALTSQISGVIIINAKAGTVVQYRMGWTSVGASSMQFALRVKIEAL